MNGEPFAGRVASISTLQKDLEDVTRGRSGRMVIVRGRRQVGKSRLVAEFAARCGVPTVFFTATLGRQPQMELDEFAEQATAAGVALPGGSAVSYRTWDAVFTAVAASIVGPTIVVVDEFPYLVAGAPDIEASFQKAWDRSLHDVPVLFIVIGSDLAMMSALTEYGRPLYGRPSREMHLAPLNPSEVAELTGMAGMDAFDAHLITGGFPNLVKQWDSGMKMFDYLAEQLATSTGPLIVAGERMITAEFPADSHARAILSAIGTGAATFTTLGKHVGLPAASLDRGLKLLVAKQVVAVDRPLSTKAPSETRYRLADTYLAFWMRFLDRAIPQIDRGRTSFVVDQIVSRWSEYRGRAIEPVIHETLARLLPDRGFQQLDDVASFWTRDQTTQVDIVVSQGTGKRLAVAGIGSIKWRANRPFDGRDASELASWRSSVPGATDATPLIGVSSSGFDVRDIPYQFGPTDLLDAWT